MLAGHDRGSIEGRGDEELLPERGDPFASSSSSDSSRVHDPQSDIFPVGEERHTEGDIQPREDGGMRAVGPPLPEDLEEVSVPPPSTGPELPPPSKFQAEPRYSTLANPASESEDESLPPFLRPKDPRQVDGSESILVSDIRINWLKERAELLQDRIEQEIDNPPLRKLLLEQIAIVHDGDIRNRQQFDEAERVLNEVENRITLAQRVRAWSASIRMRLMSVEIGMAMLIIIGLVFLPNAVRSSSLDLLPLQASGMANHLDSLIISMLWGGLGGVFSALIGLQTHRVLEEDVDRNWAIWYLATPFMGLVLGSFLFLVVRALLLLLFPSTGGEIPLVWIIYVLSWGIGFQQNLAYDLVERLTRVFTRKADISG